MYLAACQILAACKNLKHYFQVLCYFFEVLKSALHFSPFAVLPVSTLQVTQLNFRNTMRVVNFTILSSDVCVVTL